MKSETFHVRRFSNGLTLIFQPMDHVTSAAMTLAVPAGASFDPEGQEGTAAVATEWRMRGAGDRDSRALLDALEALGAQHHQGVQSRHVTFSSAQLGSNLPGVLDIFADVIQRPRMEEETFEPCRALALQDRRSLDDEPARESMLRLREKFYPHPLGRFAMGQVESLQALTSGQVRQQATGSFPAAGSILAVAGSADWENLCDLTQRCLGGWNPGKEPALETRDAEGGFAHVRKPTSQTHIALANRAAPVKDARYYAARLAETVLSGGMGGRLFTEVREKRGLAYHVGTQYHSTRDYAGLFTYAGTRPDLAQETFDVTVGELRKLAGGVTDDEIARARTQVKSSLVMQGESTSARAGALVSDWYHIGKVRSLAEICSAIDAVTNDDIMEYLRAWPAEDFTILVLGPETVDPSAARE
ncbi:MAG: M16 family metallopeptidase [Phycisphaerae bacterium]